MMKIRQISYICTPNAEVAQSVEHQLPKLRVAGSNPVCRSKENSDSQVVGYQNSLF